MSASAYTMNELGTTITERFAAWPGSITSAATSTRQVVAQLKNARDSPRVSRQRPTCAAADP